MVRRSRTAVALFFALAIMAAACSSDNSDSTATTSVSEGGGATTTVVEVIETTTTEAVETTTTEPEDVKIGVAFDIGGRGDQSINDSAGAGIDKAVAEFDVETSELEPSPDGENRVDILGVLAESGHELVIATGAAFAEDVGTVADAYPDTSFAIVDAIVDAPNVVSVAFADHEGSALVGAAAGLKTKTNKIGFIGGDTGTALGERFQAGYEAGAKEVNPDVEVVVVNLTDFPEPEQTKEAALEMYADGVDVIYYVAGGPGTSVFEVAKEASDAGESKVWAIGVVGDQYEIAGEDVRKYILTSMFKRVDVAVFSTINSFVTDSDQSGAVVLDLGADGVGYTTSGGFVDGFVDRLEELRKLIVVGDLVIPNELES
jgi:basic membrane protein A